MEADLTELSKEPQQRKEGEGWEKGKQGEQPQV